MNDLTFEYQGAAVQFVVNDRGVIDATARYNVAAYMQGGPGAWQIATPLPPIEAIEMHHWAGWFGPALDASAQPAAELEQLDACALYHVQKFGIGPGYWLIGFPSGRVWAVGKNGTHRASALGRDPYTSPPAYWNTVGRAFAMAGNYDLEPVTQGVAQACRTAVAEIRSWPGVVADAPIYGHGLLPTCNAAGQRFSQATSCPGRNLLAWQHAGGFGTTAGAQPTDYADGYRAGYQAGEGHAASELGKLAQDQHEAVLAAAAAIVSSPPPPAAVPSAAPGA